MKPGEFDDLVRQKFEQGDFEYDPKNWDRLTEELDGQKRRTGGMLFWWMPLVGVAASVAMAFGVSSVFHNEGRMSFPINADQVAAAQKPHASQRHAIAMNSGEAEVNDIAAGDDGSNYANNSNSSNTNSNINDLHAAAAAAKDNTVTISSELVAGDKHTSTPGSNVVATFNDKVHGLEKENTVAKKKKPVILNDGYYTFREDEQMKQQPKVAIILSGGVNYSSQGNGYTVGATARRMINEKVYVESDIAFVGTNNSHEVSYMDYSSNNTNGANINTATGNHSIGAKGVANKSADGFYSRTSTETPAQPQGVLKTANQPYNLYYAQITPSVGYKVMKHVSIGAGPDFQQMLVDNRPAVDPTDRSNVRVAPMFDIGFMGKTEISVTRNVKAAVYYREGINNIITPTNKYLDRNYVQFQVKCNIINR